MIEDEAAEYCDAAIPAAPGDSQADAGSLHVLIARQPFFKGLSPAQLRLLAGSAMVTRFEPNQWILRAGHSANRFYLVVEGKVALESDKKYRALLPSQTRGPGDDLGWSWLFPPFCPQFSARAVEPTRVIFFHGDRLRRQCEEDHDLGYELMRRIAGATIHTLNAPLKKQLIQIPFPPASPLC